MTYTTKRNLLFIFILIILLAAVSILYAAKQDDVPESVQSIVQNETDLLLPDLLVYPSAVFYIQPNTKTGDRELRFETKVLNQGDAQLEIQGTFDQESNATLVTQIIAKKDGTAEEKDVGKFVFHPTHEHWHFEAFSQLELWTYTIDGSLDEKVATTDKITSCIRDSNRAVPEIAGAPKAPVFGDCDEDDVQGISKGWTDTYEAKIPGQALNLTGIPDGYYAAKLKVDPDNLLSEIHKENNEAISYIAIKWDTVQILPGPLRNP